MGFGHFFVLLSTMTMQIPLIRSITGWKYPHGQEAIGQGVTPHGCAALRGTGPGPNYSPIPPAWILRATAPVVTHNGRSPRLERRRSGLTSMRRMPQALAAALVAVLCGVALAAELPANEYPTAARADYVFGCMQVNGQTRDALERCSCSIDVIASLLPYEQYEEAETVMRVRQRGGKNASMFLTTPMLRAKVDELKRAQVEAELRCF